MTANKDSFIKNLEKHSIYTRHKKDMYLPQGNLDLYQTEVQYSGVNIFNNLSSKVLLVILRDLKTSLNISRPVTPFTVRMNIILDNTSGTYILFS